jgi:hypothetical protein
MPSQGLSQPSYPDPTYVGNNSARIIGTDTVFDPNLGEQLVEIWEGTEIALATEARTRILPFGGKAKISQVDGPIYKMTVTWGDPPANAGEPEVPVERWERVTEYVQEDLRNNPRVIAAASTAETLNRWVNAIKAALKANQTLTQYYTSASDPNPVIDPAQEMIYQLYARGASSHEVKRTVLRVRRTFSVQYALRYNVDAVERIYTTAALRAAFGIPAPIAIHLPPDPALTPANTVWSWKQRQDNSVFLPGLNKIEESRDWVFAAWSTLLYELIG